MTLSSRVMDALVRVGVEVKAVRAIANAKYTKPGGGIPLSDLAVRPVVTTSDPGQLYATDWANGAQTTHTYDNEPYDETIAQRYTDGRLKVGTGVDDNDAVTMAQFNVALRWEQEILVQSGVRLIGNGAAPLGIHIPYAIKLKGVKYQFETATTSGTTTGTLMLNGTSVGASTAMSIAANGLSQNITGLDISIPAGSRLSFFLTGMGSGTGKGIYMSLWGEYA